MAWRLRAATRSLMECVAGVDKFLMTSTVLLAGARGSRSRTAPHAGKHKGVAPVSLGEFPVAWAKRLA